MKQKGTGNNLTQEILNFKINEPPLNTGGEDTYGEKKIGGKSWDAQNVRYASSTGMGGIKQNVKWKKDSSLNLEEQKRKKDFFP